MNWQSDFYALLLGRGYPPGGRGLNQVGFQAGALGCEGRVEHPARRVAPGEHHLRGLCPFARLNAKTGVTLIQAPATDTRAMLGMGCAWLGSFKKNAMLPAH